MSEAEIVIETVQAPEKGASLNGGRGINPAESVLHRPARTPKEPADLAFIGEYANIVERWGSS